MRKHMVRMGAMALISPISIAHMPERDQQQQQHAGVSIVYRSQWRVRGKGRAPSHRVDRRCSRTVPAYL